MSNSCYYLLFNVHAFWGCLSSKLATLWQPYLSLFDKCGLRLNPSHSGTQPTPHFGCHHSMVHTSNGLLLQGSEEDLVHSCAIPEKGEQDFFVKIGLFLRCYKDSVGSSWDSECQRVDERQVCIRYLHQECWIPPHWINSGFQSSHQPFTPLLSFLHFVCWLLYLSNQRAADSLTARGLADGNPPTPTDFQDTPAKAIWKYSLKTSIYLACWAFPCFSFPIHK